MLSGRLSVVRQLTFISRYLLLSERILMKLTTKFSSCEWAWLKK